ncbi:MAG: transcription antitermination factor NusB [Pikeienuella sp.]
MPREPQAPKGEDRRRMRSAARLAAVQALYQMELSGQPMVQVRDQFEAHRIGMEVDGAQYHDADIALFRRILKTALDRQAEIDQTTDRILVDKWPLGRIDATLRALFRAAGAELFGEAKTPPKVIITEYVDVARAFFTEGKEPGLANAVLDAMAREARPEAFGAAG